MVTFTCDLCQESLKKNAIDKHCQTRCRNAWVFTCVDCNKSFEGFDYQNHNSCISEEQKYYGPYAGKKQKNSGSTGNKVSDNNATQNENATPSSASSTASVIEAKVSLLKRSQAEWRKAVTTFLKSKSKFRTRGIHWNELSATLVNEFLEQSKVTTSELNQNELQQLNDQCLASIPSECLSDEDCMVRHV